MIDLQHLKEMADNGTYEIRAVVAQELLRRPKDSIDFFVHELGDSFGFLIFNRSCKRLISGVIDSRNDIFIAVKGFRKRANNVDSPSLKRT